MKKLGYLLIILAIITCFSTSVMAAENTIVTSNETERNETVAQEMTYQDVLDKLNAEYGTNAHFPEEKGNSGVSSRTSELTLEEFEDRIRHAIELNLAANERADEAIKRLTPERIDESYSFAIDECSSQWDNGKLIVTFDSQSGLSARNTTYDYYNTKLLADTEVIAEGQVNCSRGFWAFSAVDSVIFDYQPYMDIIFIPESANYSFADTRRTFCLEAYGVVTEAFTDVVIDSNARRYVEFWAGSGMPDPSTLVVE